MKHGSICDLGTTLTKAAVQFRCLCPSLPGLSLLWVLTKRSKFQNSAAKFSTLFVTGLWRKTTLKARKLHWAAKIWSRGDHASGRMFVLLKLDGENGRVRHHRFWLWLRIGLVLMRDLTNWLCVYRNTNISETFDEFSVHFWGYFSFKRNRSQTSSLSYVINRYTLAAVYEHLNKFREVKVALFIDRRAFELGELSELENSPLIAIVASLRLKRRRKRKGRSVKMTRGISSRRWILTETVRSFWKYENFTTFIFTFRYP